MRNLIQTKRLFYLRYTSLVLLIISAGCVEKSSQIITNNSVQDIEQIIKINNDYTSGWLENDSEKVLGLYADSATIIPSGMMPIQGKKSITQFWFPNDSSKTVIHLYDLEILELSVAINQAYTYEHGKLSFTYEKDDFRMDRVSESFAITIYKKLKSGEWKISKRMWTDVKR